MTGEIGASTIVTAAVAVEREEVVLMEVEEIGMAEEMAAEGETEGDEGLLDLINIVAV